MADPSVWHWIRDDVMTTYLTSIIHRFSPKRYREKCRSTERLFYSRLLETLSFFSLFGWFEFELRLHFTALNMTYLFILLLILFRWRRWWWRRRRRRRHVVTTTSWWRRILRRLFTVSPQNVTEKNSVLPSSYFIPASLKRWVLFFVWVIWIWASHFTALNMTYHFILLLIILFWWRRWWWRWRRRRRRRRRRDDVVTKTSWWGRIWRRLFTVSAQNVTEKNAVLPSGYFIPASFETLSFVLYLCDLNLNLDYISPRLIWLIFYSSSYYSILMTTMMMMMTMTTTTTSWRRRDDDVVMTTSWWRRHDVVVTSDWQCNKIS